MCKIINLKNYTKDKRCMKVRKAYKEWLQANKCGDLLMNYAFFIQEYKLNQMGFYYN